MRIREVDMVDTGQVSRSELAEMEQYLGPSTLAKLQTVDEDSEEVDAYVDFAADVDTDSGDEDYADFALGTSDEEDTETVADMSVIEANLIQEDLEEEVLEDEIQDDAQ
jgi:hypothetical protein